MELKCIKCGKTIGETTSLKAADMLCSECLSLWQTEQEVVKEEIEKQKEMQDEFLKLTKEDIIILKEIINEHKNNINK